jgi:flagellar basal body-associated protein FliL
MSEETKLDTDATLAMPKKKKQTLIIVGVVIIAIVIVIALLVANALIQNTPQATTDFKAASWNVSQSLSGPTTFTVQVTNDGGSSGSGTLYCFVNIGVNSYSNSHTVDLNAGGSTTVTIVVDTPYGTTVTKSMCGVYFS